MVALGESAQVRCSTGFACTDPLAHGKFLAGGTAVALLGRLHQAKGSLLRWCGTRGGRPRNIDPREEKPADERSEPSKRGERSTSMFETAPTSERSLLVTLEEIGQVL